MSVVREEHLEARLRTRVRLAGGAVYKLAPFVRGTPDDLVLLPGGRMYLVELKALDGRLDPAQALWHERAHDVGVDVVVLWGPAQIDQWVYDRMAERWPQDPRPGRPAMTPEERYAAAVARAAARTTSTGDPS